MHWDAARNTETHPSHARATVLCGARGARLQAGRLVAGLGWAGWGKLVRLVPGVAALRGLEKA